LNLARDNSVKLVYVINASFLASFLVMQGQDAENSAEPGENVDANHSAEVIGERLTPQALELDDAETLEVSEPTLESEVMSVNTGTSARPQEDVVALNEIPMDGFTLRGAAVQWIKTDNVLQLLNPFAPEEYGSGVQNLAYDAITGRPKGLLIFAIDFGGKRSSR
jgi:hypothetical protein